MKKINPIRFHNFLCNVLIVLGLLILFISFVSATDYTPPYSELTADYYYEGSYYLQEMAANYDGSDWRGLNNNTIVNGENACTHSGWGAVTGCVGIDYSVCSSPSGFCLDFPTGNLIGIEHILASSEGAMEGTLFATVKFTQLGTGLFHLLRAETGEPDIYLSVNPNGAFGYDVNNCDLNEIRPDTTGTYYLLVNWTSPTTATTYVANDSNTNYVSCHTFIELDAWVYWRTQNSGTTDWGVQFLELGATTLERITVAAPPPGVPATPSIVVPSPANNANNNTNVTLNVSHSTPSNDVRYYLYFGDTSSLTEGHLIYDNVTRNGSEYSEWTTNVSDGIYYWKFRVQNITDGTFSSNTTQRTWTLDTVTPTITRLSGNNWKTNNLTIISSYINDTLVINISFFDLNLAGGQTLINITNSTDESMFFILNTSITGTTANYSRTVNVSTWAVGNYTIKLAVADSHTDLEWGGGVEVHKGLDYFRYTTPEGNIITIESDTFPLTRRTTKLKDRYDFKFNYLFQKDTYKFRIISYNKIDYLEDSKATSGPHFVIWGNNLEGNWIDFENPNLNEKDYKVTKIDDYIYEIEVTANDLKSFTFNSIGGLNKAEEHYKLRIGAVLDVWVYDEENYPRQINTTVTSGSQSANSTINISGARLVNITREITGLTLASSGYGTEIEEITITSNYHNFSFNMTPVSAAKLYFYDEKSEALITGETFSVYLETTGFSNTYSAATNPYTIIGLINGLYKLKASSTNYPERQYLDLNISNVTTTNLNIYLINNTLGSEITFNIVDEGLNPLKDVRAIFAKIINGSSTVIAEENSDFAGQVVLTLDEDSQYTINFSKASYEDQTITLEPKNAEYVIKMISTIGKYNQSVYEGIRYKFEPSNTVLNNGTRYNFTFTLNSSVWTVTNCTLKLKNGSILLNETSNFTSNSCFMRIEQDTLDMTTIISEATYELDSTYEFIVTQQYSIIYTYEGEFSLKNFLDDLSDFAMAGFDDFGRMILALIVIFVITSLAAQKIGFTNPEVLIFIVITQVWFFSSVNWLYLDFAPIPTIVGFDLKKYIIAILITLAGGAFVIEKFTK